MIAAFLLPFPVRGHRAPYLWVYYRLLSAFNERLLFIASRDYVRPPASWAIDCRWEMQEISGQRLGYAVPGDERMADHDYRFVPDDIFSELLAAHGSNPIAVFRAMLTQRIPSLERAFVECLRDTSADRIETILTWCNCPSLNAVAEAKGIRVMHLELGPLRWPDYRSTAYLDFTGVNGNTEAEARYGQSGFANTRYSIPRLRRFFATSAPPRLPAAEFDLGIALQVEDDSNLIAFGNGFDNQSLLVHAQLDDASQRKLVRAHPGSLFAVKPGSHTVDASPNSIEFIRRCAHLLTINSSVGLEALLLDIPVTTMGDSSYRHIAEADGHERSSRLAHYLFAYLVPMDLIYQADYLRFRLSDPGEDRIVRRHLAAYLGRPEIAAATASGPEVIDAVLPADGLPMA
jgi:hypothetical protein